jgi:SAM-dependent methyltransferase
MSWEEAVVWLRNQKKQSDLVKACYYDDPLIDAVTRYWESSEWKAVSRFLPDGKGTVLDLGAGRGISSFAFAKDGWKVTALEPDNSTLVGTGAIDKIVKETGLNIRVCNEWGEKLPFADETFDVVFARQALHHAGDLKKLCEEMGRVLKEGGTFIAIREHVISKKSDLPAFLEKHPLHYLYGGENAFLLEEYIQAIQKAGIQLTEIINPLESDINLFPRQNKYIPKFFTKKIGNIINYPGRIYSFVGKKL